MTLPEIQLDDRGFQDLVKEARERIGQSCPEWTEHNVSDPGITLIEQFAWMTDLMLYRLNRIPDKLHIALMELLGIQLDPPAAARVGVLFRVAQGFEGAVRIPATTEVGTRRVSGEDAIVFQVEEEFTIEPLRPEAYVLSRGGQIQALKMIDGAARPLGNDQHAFANPPQEGDALYLGFSSPVGRLVLEVNLEASQARGAGVDPANPPLVWEVSAGDRTWVPATVLADGTGGFNRGSGAVELQMPPRSGAQAVGAQKLHWVRCRYAPREPADGELAGARYDRPPEITQISARPVGALVDASHSVLVRTEVLGTSDGTPGQRFSLRSAPALPLAANERLEVLESAASQEERERQEWQPWEARESLADSGSDDQHFVIDLASGTIEFGPVIRLRTGVWRQFGAIPPKGAQLRMTGYRHGGGHAGNVAPGTLTMLKTSLPGVGEVTNPEAAIDGFDPEPLPRARQRAGLEIRSRHRAVTAGDFEFYAGEASQAIARALCVPPSDGAPMTLRMLRKADEPARQLTLEQLSPSTEDFRAVRAHLDEHRLIGTTLDLGTVRLRGVTAVVQVQATPTADPVLVQQKIEKALYGYLNPLIGGSTLGPSDGWPFGRPLNPGELFSIVQAVAGVAFIKTLVAYETDLATGEQARDPIDVRLDLEPDELIASAQHGVKVSGGVS
jgi:predicted phage baseplate assembly protein